MVDQETEHRKMEYAGKFAQYDSENKWSLELFRSVILAGQTALKSAILINGGAAVALLAFIGSVWDKTTNPNVIKKLLISMVLFVLGVLAGGIASSLTYLIQLLYLNQKHKLATFLNVTSSVLITISYITFVIGAVFAFVAFWNQF